MIGRGANAQTASFFTLYGGQFPYSTQLITLNYSPTNAAPQFLQKLIPFIHITTITCRTIRQPVGLNKNSLFTEFLPVQFEVCTTTSSAWHAKHYAIMCPLYTSLYSSKFKAFPNINSLFPEVQIFIIVGGS